jgi:hypothetical protein
MKADFATQVRNVEWSRFPHPCEQDQSLIPTLILQMVDGDEQQQLGAAQRLWDVAAHQGNVGSSAVPVSRFLFELLQKQAPVVQVENLDTLYQFSNYLVGQEWSADLRAAFCEALPLLEHLSMSGNEDVSDFSRMIMENVRGSHPSRAEPGTSPNGGTTCKDSSEAGSSRHR